MGPNQTYGVVGTFSGDWFRPMADNRVTIDTAGVGSVCVIRLPGADQEICVVGADDGERRRYGDSWTYRTKAGAVRVTPWKWTNETDPVVVAESVRCFGEGLRRVGAEWSPSPATVGAWLYADAHPNRPDFSRLDREPWTSGQGRFEWIDPVPGEACQVWDMRAAYTAQMRGIPLWAGYERSTKTVRQVGQSSLLDVRSGVVGFIGAWQRAYVRWNLEGRVFFGPIPVTDGTRWTWPLKGEGWASPEEVRGLPAIGVEVLETVTGYGDVDRYRPVHPDLFRPIIDRLARAASEAPPHVSTPAMMRAVKIQLIGRMASKSTNTVEVRRPLAEVDETFDAGHSPRIEGTDLVGTIHSQGGLRALENLPAACTVWARTRAALARRAERAELADTGTVVAMRADALWTRRPLNDPDDGRAGTFRHKADKLVGGA